LKLVALGTIAALLSASPCLAQHSRGFLDTEDLPVYLHDRGEGQPVSMFATYVQNHQWLIYPFFEYYRDHDLEYKPKDFGFGLDEDFRGKYEATEELLFFAYAFNDNVALEMEGAIIQAKLTTSPDDPTAIPKEIEESGLGDVEGQLRWRWNHETEKRPEFFSWFEFVIPTADEGSLIGTTDWEFTLGGGLIRGFRWGTVDARVGGEYTVEDGSFALGEFGFDYTKRLSPSWRILAGVEGSQDEVSAITDIQWHFKPKAFLKLNNGFALSSKATDWAPEIGVMIGL